MYAGARFVVEDIAGKVRIRRFGLKEEAALLLPDAELVNVIPDHRRVPGLVAIRSVPSVQAEEEIEREMRERERIKRGREREKERDSEFTMYFCYPYGSPVVLPHSA
jgi:hypothetical protein